MKKILFSLMLLFVYLPNFVLAANLGNAFGDGSALGSVSSKAGYNDIQSGTESSAIDPIISKTIGIVLSFLGVIFLILTIYAGYLWMTAQGDSKKVEEAKDIITRAVVGLIVVVSAYAISTYVISKTLLPSA